MLVPSRLRALKVSLLFGLLPIAFVACFGARTLERNYFVLHGDPVEPGRVPPVDGLVRVRDMDMDSVYEKFQIVVRRSPYQLRYSEQNVWAVKPNQMVSDQLAQALESSGAFSGVTRQLLDARPAYTMAGKVLAIELYDSGDLWFAHLSLHLQLTRFGDGKALWAFEFDQRKEIDADSFDHGVRALSELLHAAIQEAVGQVQSLESVARGPAPLRRRRLPIAQPTEEPASPAPEPWFVPERPAPDGEAASVPTSTAVGQR